MKQTSTLSRGHPLITSRVRRHKYIQVESASGSVNQAFSPRDQHILTQENEVTGLYNSRNFQEHLVMQDQSSCGDTRLNSTAVSELRQQRTLSGAGSRRASRQRPLTSQRTSQFQHTNMFMMPSSQSEADDVSNSLTSARLQFIHQQQHAAQQQRLLRRSSADFATQRKRTQSRNFKECKSATQVFQSNHSNQERKLMVPVLSTKQMISTGPLSSSNTYTSTSDGLASINLLQSNQQNQPQLIQNKMTPLSLTQVQRPRRMLVDSGKPSKQLFKLGKGAVSRQRLVYKQITSEYTQHLHRPKLQGSSQGGRTSQLDTATKMQPNRLFNPPALAESFDSDLPIVDGDLQYQIKVLKSQLQRQIEVSREVQIKQMQQQMLMASELNIQKRTAELLQSHLIQNIVDNQASRR